MLYGEAVIAEVLGALFLAYTSAKHIKGSEGIGVATGIVALVLFVAIPFTKHFIG